MCGIAGLITKDGVRLSAKHYQKRNKIFTGLLVAMQERGEQSAGVAFVDKDKLAIVKSPTSAVKFIKNNRFKTELNKNYPLIIGHTRFATMGKINKNNAHPFLRGSIVGVHNGTINNVDNFERFKNKIQVDSELIFELLNESDNNFVKTFRKIEGNFAIAWTKIEKDKYSLYLVKSGNPLYLAYIKELKTYFYCSTAEALQVILLSHYNEVEIIEMPYEKVKVIDSQLNIQTIDVDFKERAYSSYYCNNKFTDDKDSKKKRQTTWDYEDDIDNGFCGQCHKSLEYCQCDLICSDCGEDIDGVYYVVSSAWVLCENCYDFYEMKNGKKKMLDIGLEKYE